MEKDDDADDEKEEEDEDERKQKYVNFKRLSVVWWYAIILCEI